MLVKSKAPLAWFWQRCIIYIQLYIDIYYFFKCIAIFFLFSRCKHELGPYFPVQSPFGRPWHSGAGGEVSAGDFLQRSQSRLQGHVHSVADGFGMIWHGVASALGEESDRVTAGGRRS